MEQGIKKTVEELITNLQKQGIKVDGAAILKLDINNPEQDKTVDEIVDKIMGNLGISNVNTLKKETAQTDQTKQPADLPELEENPDGTTVGCICPNCFNFETFEQQLASRGGNFDYLDVKLGGKDFSIKYYFDGKGDERMMISPKAFKAPAESTLEQLQEALNQAVKNKQFDKAQAYLNAINQIKNQ